MTIASAPPRPPAAAGDRPLAAAAAMLGATATLSLGDAVVRALGMGWPLSEVFILRSAAATPLLLALLVLERRGGRAAAAPAAGATAAASGDWRWIGVRSVLLATMWVLYFSGLPHLPLGVSAAGINTSPLILALLSTAVTGDRPGWGGAVGVAAAMAGMALVLRPGGDLGPDGPLWALAPLAGALVFALAALVTRARLRAASPVVLTLGLNAAQAVAGAGLAIFETAPWILPDALGWLAVLALAVSMVAGAMGIAYAYQKGPPARMGALNVSYVGFASLWGAVFFAETLGTWTLVGLVLIAGGAAIAALVPPPPPRRRG